LYGSLPETGEDNKDINSKEFVLDRTSKILNFLSLKEQDDANNAALSTGITQDRVTPINVHIPGYNFDASMHPKPRVTMIDENQVKNFKLRVNKLNSLVESKSEDFENVAISSLSEIVPGCDVELINTHIAVKLSDLVAALNA